MFRESVRPLVLLLIVAGPAHMGAQTFPDWTSKLRRDHPRLFFNADSWPAVRERALGQERAWYDRVRTRVDRLLRRLGEAEGDEIRDLGPDAARAAFVYLVTREERYLTVAKKALEVSLTFYERCYQARKSVNWYSTTRVHATMAWDWLYNDLTAEERQRLFSRLVRVLQNVFMARPSIYRENLSGHTTGFYGATNCRWFIGCTGYGTGIEERLVNDWLVWGYSENRKLLSHRRRACGDDGGSASPTLGYAFGAYPWAEQNFFYTWLSATGENIAPEWPHGAWLANYVIWNWIETGGIPREFGYGDTPHTGNYLRDRELYTHMANIRHFFGRHVPEAAALARSLQEKLPEGRRRYSDAWFIYPFLLADLEQSSPAMALEGLPRARHFDTMGQVFLRSGTGPEDTYCLFTCGGILSQHRHYDALNFVIYHKGFLALDSGTRYKEFENGQHLANYFAQTVAHNCVVIQQPGEPPARYWGGTVEGCHGGQHRQLGSVVKAFETNDEYVYVAGDATRCYLHGQSGLPDKASLVTRQLVFLLPRHFIVFDRVTSTDSSYTKDWLLHTAQRPLIEDKTIRAEHLEGRMLCRTLLPEDATLTAVGGPGRQFWAAGKNWEIDQGALKPENLAMMGQWRVEVSPGAPRAEDLFLHLIEVGDRGLEAMADCGRLRSPTTEGVRLTVGAHTWEVHFRTRGDLGGRIRRGGPGKRIDKSLAGTVQRQVGILATR